MAIFDRLRRPPAFIDITFETSTTIAPVKTRKMDKQYSIGCAFIECSSFPTSRPWIFFDDAIAQPGTDELLGDMPSLPDSLEQVPLEQSR